MSTAQHASRASGLAQSRRSLDSHSLRGWPGLSGRPAVTPVRSSGTYTRDEEGSFRPVLPALRDRLPASASSTGGWAQLGSMSATCVLRCQGARHKQAWTVHSSAVVADVMLTTCLLHAALRAWCRCITVTPAHLNSRCSMSICRRASLKVGSLNLCAGMADVEEGLNSASASPE